jgi:hypothetical protein
VSGLAVDVLGTAVGIAAPAAMLATVAVGDALAVLHEPTGRVHLLNDTTARVWRRAAGGSDAASSVDAALGAVDDPNPDRPTASATVDQPMRAGLLTGPA